MNLAKESDALKVDGRLLRGLADVGDETAEYLLPKAILLGFTDPLENVNLQASINTLNGYSPAAKKNVTNYLHKELENIRQLLSISNAFNGNRHHARLVRLFLCRCNPDDRHFRVLMAFEADSVKFSILRSFFSGLMLFPVLSMQTEKMMPYMNADVLKTILVFLSIQTAKMMPYMNADVLKTILVFLSMTSDGTTDVARAMLTSNIHRLERLERLKGLKLV